MGVMSLDKFDQVLIEFVDSQMMPTAPTYMKFLIGGSVPIIISKKDQLIKQYLPLGKTMGLVDDQGRILIDNVEKFLNDGFAKSGRIQVGSIIFTPEDATALINIMRKYEDG
nr:MAG TPA: hypothetical protein [Caudoviricetes sp.]